MAIYGLNFTGQQIPERAKALFPLRRRLKTGQMAELKGVCQTEEETVAMSQAASRPGRLLHFQYRDGWFGCYIASV